jgi:hypothetical protein
MHTIGAEARGKPDIVCDEAGEPASLHEIDQWNVILAGRRGVRTEQDASRIGVCRRVRELARKVGRRLHGKLKI